MRSVQNKQFIYLILLTPLGVLLSYASSRFPQVIEKYYAQGVDRTMIQLISTITGFFPFSLAEMMVLSLSVFLTWKFVRMLLLLLKRNAYRKKIIGRCILTLTAVLSVIYFLFIFLWGLNYYRQTFAQTAHYSTKPYTTEELAEVCSRLIEQTNELRKKADQTPNGTMILPNGEDEIFLHAADGYQIAAGVYPVLKGNFGKPKRILLSEPMSYFGLTGVYCPFTGEPNVNTAIPEVLLPATVCHEIAHQHGFAREDEANYIAYLTCRMNPNPVFQYSGSLLAVINLMKAIKTNDMDRYLQLKRKYSGQVRKDLQLNSIYWEKHEGFIERITNRTNDLYLKSNQQHTGVGSYNRMVDLIIAESRQNVLSR